MLYNKDGVQLICFIVYDYNSEEERQNLWETLYIEANTYAVPWVVMGDFNCAHLNKEKLMVVLFLTARYRS